MKKLIIAILIVVLLPFSVYALTPIARFDVVPRQRVEYGSSFNVGVVAFSKAGIQDVVFTIIGQGYSSGTKTSTSMTLNTRVASASPGAVRDGVYEYYVNIPANEFSTDGTFTVSALVTGDDAGTKSLSAITLLVEATGAGTPVEAWIATDGNDSTGAVDDDTKPYLTMAAAVTDIETANGGDCDNAIIYFENGTYNTTHFTASSNTTTTSEWLTLTRSSSATMAGVIFDEGNTVLNTNHLKISGVTIRSSGVNDYFIQPSNNLWVDQCKLTSIVGRVPTGTNPVWGDAGNTYYTSDYVYDTRYGVRGPILARGIKIEKVGNDAFVNNSLIINCTADDIDPTGTNAYDCNGANEVCHADVYQQWGSGRDNVIIYNYYATDVNYQGLFMRQESGGDQTNTAFVNMFIELRTLISGGGYSGVYGNYDHFILWHNTFVGTGEPGHWGWASMLFAFEPNYSPDERSFNNSSIIGNVFHRFIWAESSSSTFDYENSDNNVASYNHFEIVVSTIDSNSPTTATTGDDVIDIVTPGSETFGYPVDEASIIDRLPSNLTGILVDAYGNLRDSTPDVGALEIVEESPDVSSPTPDPMTWASEPGEDSPTQISMESTTGSDSSTPIEYYFNYDQANTQCGDDGGTGGTDSGWQSADTTYSDTVNEPNHCYGYTVRARDAIPNTGTASSVSEDYTAANTPGTPTLSSPTQTTLRVSNDANGNPESYPTTLYAIQVVSTSPNDSYWLNKWINSATGAPSDTALWSDDTTWDAVELQGLNPATTFGAKSKARNEDGTETPLSSEGQGTTEAGFIPAFQGASGSGLNLSP